MTIMTPEVVKALRDLEQVVHDEMASYQNQLVGKQAEIDELTAKLYNHRAPEPSSEDDEDDGALQSDRNTDGADSEDGQVNGENLHADDMTKDNEEKEGEEEEDEEEEDEEKEDEEPKRDIDDQKSPCLQQGPSRQDNQESSDSSDDEGALRPALLNVHFHHVKQQPRGNQAASYAEEDQRRKADHSRTST